MEQTYKSLAREFDRLADITKDADDAARRAYWSERNARSGDTARAIHRMVGEYRAQAVTCKLEIRRLLARAGF